MIAIYRRELRSYMTSVYGLLFAAVLLLVAGIVMYRINLLNGLADTSYNLVGYGEYTLGILLPLIAMRAMTRDRKTGIDLFYLSLPLRTSAVVMGKYLAALTLMVLPTGILALYPLLLSGYGKINMVGAYTSLLMYFLLAAALLGLCMFLASLTKYMAVAVILGIVGCAFFCFVPNLVLYYLPYTALASFVGFGVLAILLTVIAWFATRSTLATAITAAAAVIPLTVLYILDAFVFKWGAFEGLFYVVLAHSSPFHQFQSVITSGYFDLFSVIVMLAFAAFFLLLTVQSVNRRRMA